MADHQDPGKSSTTMMAQSGFVAIVHWSAKPHYPPPPTNAKYVDGCWFLPANYKGSQHDRKAKSTRELMGLFVLCARFLHTKPQNVSTLLKQMLFQAMNTDKHSRGYTAADAFFEALWEVGIKPNLVLALTDHWRIGRHNILLRQPGFGPPSTDGSNDQRPEVQERTLP